MTEIRTVPDPGAVRQDTAAAARRAIARLAADQAEAGQLAEMPGIPAPEISEEQNQDER